MELVSATQQLTVINCKKICILFCIKCYVNFFIIKFSSFWKNRLTLAYLKQGGFYGVRYMLQDISFNDYNILRGGKYMIGNSKASFSMYHRNFAFLEQNLNFYVLYESTNKNKSKRLWLLLQINHCSYRGGSSVPLVQVLLTNKYECQRAHYPTRSLHLSGIFKHNCIFFYRKSNSSQRTPVNYYYSGSKRVFLWHLKRRISASPLPILTHL